jgi:5-formyltetrahydrofolate cyclo-ligase
MSDLIAVKRAMRANALQARETAHFELGATAPAAVRDHFLATFKPPRKRAIAAYWAVRTEIDVAPLLTALAGRGNVCALPAVAAHRGQLEFRRWQPGDTLAPGVMNIHEPAPNAPVIEPDIFIVPLLAFDATGHRLGYGGGYYDRALVAARAVRKIVAIGVAFSVQELPLVPHGPSDERLDGVVTELGARRFGRGKKPE